MSKAVLRGIGWRWADPLTQARQAIRATERKEVNAAFSKLDRAAKKLQTLGQLKAEADVREAMRILREVIEQ